MAGIHQALGARLDAQLAGLIQTPSNGVRSAALRLETLGGALLYEGAVGEARPDTGAPMTTATRFHHASIGKTYTAVAILRLWEDGAFGREGLDVPLSQFALFAPEVMKRLHVHEGLNYSNAITLRHLLTHTSGIKDAMTDDRDGVGGPAPGSLIGRMMSPAGDPTRAWIAWDPTRPDDPQAGVINFYLNEGIGESALSPPGARFHYSDTGFMILALLVQHLAGKPFGQVLQERIYRPFGLQDTYLAYARDPDGLGPRREPEAEVYFHGSPCLSQGNSLSFDWGGGGTVSTAGDLTAFLRGLATGRLFRRAETYGAMTDWLTPDGLVAPRLGVGLGLFRVSYPKGELWGHSGAWGAKMFYDPRRKLVFAGTINQSTGLGNWHWTLLEEAVSILDAEVRA